MFNAITIKKIIRNLMIKTNIGYRFYLRKDTQVQGPLAEPIPKVENCILRSDSQIEESLLELTKLGLPTVHDRPKNWDSLAALSVFLKYTNQKSRILDAGGESYSMILPWLALYRFKYLEAINLVFSKDRLRLGPITYQYGDITDTDYEDNTFEGISCLSVVEHGVDLDKFFKEMSRILRPGGVIVISVDYFESPTDTRGQSAYGVPIHILSREEIEIALDIAGKYGLTLSYPISLLSEERVVHWQPYGLYFTFLLFTLHKKH